MGDFLNNLFANHFGLATTVVVAVIALVIFVTWKIHDLMNMHKSLPCESHAKDLKTHTIELQKHNESIGTVKSSLSRIEGQLGVMLQVLTNNPAQNDLAAAVDFSDKHSPRRLNANGTALLSDIDGLGFLNDNRAALFAEIGKFSPKTPLDVENVALMALRIKQADSMFNKIKNWVYNAPEREIVNKAGEKVKTEITMENVLFVLSLPLRDMYLDAHPDILNN